jgi:uncharacterized protein (DUF433 family)
MEEVREMKEIGDRITVDPGVLVGKPTIRGLRISVEQILKALAAGVTTQDLLQDYPDLEEEDIKGFPSLCLSARRRREGVFGWSEVT